MVKISEAFLRIRFGKYFSIKKIPDYLHPQILRLFLMLLIFVSLPTFSNYRVSNSQPNAIGNDLVEINLPSPVPSLTPQAVQINEEINIIEQEIINVDIRGESIENIGNKDYSHLCEGISEAWKLVPNPDQDGQFIVCNSETGEMSGVGDLNNAQNNYRVSNGLNNLTINNELCAVAAERAVEVASNFSHDGFESAIDRHNLQFNSIGENIASGPLTATQLVQWSWDKSPGHRENMLGDWSDGCGGIHDIYAVFVFAK